MSRHDRHQLVIFLDDLRQIFKILVEQRSKLFPRIQGPLAEAWPEINDLINRIIDLLQNPEHFRGPVTLDDHLATAGLIDPQLALKLAAFNTVTTDLNDFLQELNAFLNEFDIFNLGREQLRKLRKLLKIINRLLAYANIILGSLSQAIPISEPVKEFKDILKEGVDDILDNDQDEQD